MSEAAAELTSEELELVGDLGEKDVVQWTEHIKDADLKTALSKFDNQDKFFESIGIELETSDWRSDLPDDLKETADKLTSPTDAIRAIVAFRKRDSQVRVPGKDATDDERKAYNKAVGIPESVDGYEFPAMPEGPGESATETEVADHKQILGEIKTSRETWAKRFHDLKVPKDTAKQLTQALNEDLTAKLALQIDADKVFAASQKEDLKTEWKDDYEKNGILAERAAKETAKRAGVNFEELTKIETKDGRFLMDNSSIIRLFAVIGREMGESTLGSTLTASELETAEEELRSLRKQQTEAQDAGESRRADALYQKEQMLIASMKGGDEPIVGSGARTV